MSTIEEKIQACEYSSAIKAAASIKMSKLPKGERIRLMAMIPQYYPQTEVAKIPKADQLDSPVRINGQPEPALNHELVALALKVMSLAVKHRLSREQVFDLLKERTVVEG